MNDPIADILIRIKNGYMAKLTTVDAPYSKTKEVLCKLLKKLGFIADVTKPDEKKLTIQLKYSMGVPALTGVKRLSKPGLRRYMNVSKLKTMRQGLGFVIVSTSKGLKTHVEAKKERLGGELFCQIW